MFVKNDVTQLKNDISRFIGSKVKLETNKGRHKAMITEGTIESVYPSIFTVLVDLPIEEGALMNSAMNNMQRKISYSYTDVLTRAVEITVFE